MDHNALEDESPKEFAFPMSKMEKQKQDHLEFNIKSIIDDEIDFNVKNHILKSSSPSIQVQTFEDQYPSDPSKLTGTNTGNQKLSPSSNSQTLPATLNEDSKKSEALPQGERKKLNLMSSNYKPKEKVFKKGKLKKPQSQKEPSVSKPGGLLGNFNKPSQFHVDRYNDSSMAYNGTLTSIYDQECSSNSNTYNALENSTTSSTGESANLYQKWDTYSAGPPPGYYMHPGYHPYTQNYYHHQPPPGFFQTPQMMPQQMSVSGYSDYMPGQAPVQQVPRVASPLLDPNSLLKSPVKAKKGFRKVKSTNEKTTPIDPAARALIFNCDKQPNIHDKLELLKGQLDLLIYNQSGSRFLQKLLTKANKEIIEFFLSEIDSSLNKLMMDKYGNYFCQELLLS